MNTIYFGDNLDILREYIPDESVDLIYLDPPFNSKRAYNIIFRDKDGKYPPSQIAAFDDTWSWSEETEKALDELTKQQYPAQLFRTLKAFETAMGTTDMMAYLVMMGIRLCELHRVLKKTGSIYLHCDPTASHYLKIVMDQIFGIFGYKNEITWKRSLGHNLATNRFDIITDIILFYAKTNDCIFNRQYQPISDAELEEKFPHVEKETGRKFNHQKLEKSSNVYSKDETRIIDGREVRTNLGWIWTQETFDKRLKENPLLIYWTEGGKPRYKLYADECEGKLTPNLWDDIPAISSNSKESLGYPTQKPVALLERIIKASSNEGDVVLDPFCGCGTTIAAAEKLNRKWLGIDITVLAINLIEKRLKEHFPDVK